MIAEHAIDWTKPMQEEARREGRREGEKRGRQQGEAELLLRMMSRRHGSLAPAIEERIRNAEAEQLLEWGERFVTASTLAEICDGTRAD